MPTARGPLEVNMQPEPPFLEQDGLTLNRNLVVKQFSGGMAGSSEAQMIAAFTATPVQRAMWPSSTSPARSTGRRAVSYSSTAAR